MLNTANIIPSHAGAEGGDCELVKQHKIDTDPTSSMSSAVPIPGSGSEPGSPPGDVACSPGGNSNHSGGGGEMDSERQLERHVRPYHLHD